MSESGSLNVAVIGGGVAGIAAAHRLSRKHRVTLFDAAGSLGGHARTLPVDDGAGGTVGADTGFLVCNEDTYPLFLRLVDELGVRSSVVPAEMSASFSDETRDLHYALRRGLYALFHGHRNALRPGFYRMFAEVLAFRRRAARDLATGTLGNVTVGEYLAPYSELLRENFVLPLTACIWSMPPRHIWSYPAASMLRFFDNHRLLSGRGTFAWRTFRGGSGVYVDAFLKRFRGTLRLGARVTRVRRSPGPAVHTAEGAERFDRVVLATHADTALELIEDPTRDEHELLGPWTYQPNVVLLHTDPSLMHPDRRLWASWNYRVTTRGPAITYHLNRVQSLTASRDLFLSLTEDGVAQDRILDRQVLAHPVFTAQAVATQPRLGLLNGPRQTYFCGSYFGYGFHEDAVASAYDVAAHLGVPAD